MTELVDDDDRLLDRIREHEREIQRLRSLLKDQGTARTEQPRPPSSAAASQLKWPLKQAEYGRYGRQLILPEVGINGQLRLRNAKVLIVGIGGLGCPAAAYLAGAGVGTLGLMDGDRVEVSNLHRQVLHSTERVGMLKVESAESALRQLNPSVQYKLHPYHLDARSAIEDFCQYDLVLDCTDHPTSRYLVSDAAVCAGIPLISGAALRTDGQLYVLNFPPFRPVSSPNYVSGPCYRCVHPKPPPAEVLVTCGEGGILGPVVGTIGVLMATEAIKIIASSPYYSPRPTRTSDHEKSNGEVVADPVSSEQDPPPPNPSMLMYSAYASPPFRSIRLRGRRPQCVACSPDPGQRTVNTESVRAGEVDYVAFCGQLSPTSLLPSESRMDPQQLARTRDLPQPERVLLLDVRNETEFEIGNLEGSMHVPLEQVKRKAADIAAKVTREGQSFVIAVCRFGNDSQVAAKILLEEFSQSADAPWIGDLRGGLAAWTRDVDPDFPSY